MKKTIGIFLAALLSLVIPLSAAATELTTCTVTAESVEAAPGATVTVAIRIAGNPGFTNFAISLDYDREHLTLMQIATSNGDTPYLCGKQTAVNLHWNDDTGFVVAATEKPVKDDGILFVATFAIDPEFLGEAYVTPVVGYIRNNEAVFSVFEQIRAVIAKGKIRSDLSGVLAGDLTGDGVVEYNDVMLAYQAYLGEAQLTAAQMAAVDTDRNGTVEETEYRAVYQIYLGG